MKDVDIMIFGTSRCGKTTLSNMLAERFHYPIIHNDALRTAFHDVFSIPWGGGARASLLEQNACALFAHRYLRSNKACDGFQKRYILEGVISVQYARLFFHPEKNIIYFLGMAELTLEELFDEIRNTASFADWTTRLSDQELQQYLSGFLSSSVNNKKLCAQYGLPFVETSGDREAILTALADEIAERIAQIDSEDDTP